MGFTISLFVAELAFDEPADVARARIRVLAATVVAALGGALAFAVIVARERRRSPHPGRLLRPLDPTRDPVLGDPVRAVVTVVEYGDFTTPYSPLAEEMRREIAGRFGDDVVYTFRHPSLDRPLGHAAALATEAAAVQGRFWQMRDELIRQAPIEDERQIRRAAASAQLNLRRFDRDRDRQVGAWRVDQDAADCEAMHLQQAPAYFIDGVRHDGPIDAASVNAAVAAARQDVLEHRRAVRAR